LVQEIDLGEYTGSCALGDVDESGLVLRLADGSIAHFARRREAG
jgi:hypothetical protein